MNHPWQSRPGEKIRRKRKQDREKRKGKKREKREKGGEVRGESSVLLSMVSAKTRIWRRNDEKKEKGKTRTRNRENRVLTNLTKKKI